MCELFLTAKKINATKSFRASTIVIIIKRNLSTKMIMVKLTFEWKHRIQYCQTRLAIHKF